MGLKSPAFIKSGVNCSFSSNLTLLLHSFHTYPSPLPSTESYDLFHKCLDMNFNGACVLGMESCCRSIELEWFRTRYLQLRTESGKVEETPA